MTYRKIKRQYMESEAGEGQYVMWSTKDFFFITSWAVYGIRIDTFIAYITSVSLICFSFLISTIFCFLLLHCFSSPSLTSTSSCVSRCLLMFITYYNQCLWFFPALWEFFQFYSADMLLIKKPNHIYFKKIKSVALSWLHVCMYQTLWTVPQWDNSLTQSLSSFNNLTFHADIRHIWRSYNLAQLDMWLCLCSYVFLLLSRLKAMLARQAHSNQV